MAGTCIDFKAEGSKCVPMSSSDLYDDSILQYKCADVVSKGGKVVLVEGPGASGCE